MAGKPRVRIDRKALDRAVQAGIAPIQDDYNRRLRERIRGVRDQGGDRSADEVYGQLVAALDDEFGGGLTLDEENLRRYAEAIAAGELED